MDKVQPYGPTEFMRKEKGISHITKQIRSNFRRVFREYERKKLEYDQAISVRGKLAKNTGLTPFRAFMGALFKIIQAICQKCLRRCE